MIELIYNEEETAAVLVNPLLEPKNVKQIGMPGMYKKIYLEDFVHTYLLQLSRESEEQRVGVLLGNSLKSGRFRHIYIKSAIWVKNLTQKFGRYEFPEKAWGFIYQECEKYFPDQEILGWFLSRPGFSMENHGGIESTHRTYFSGADKVLFMMEPLEEESTFFAFDGNQFQEQTGYYIYYEKNETMREYMMEKRGCVQKRNSTEKPDATMANFRKILKEKQAKKEKRKKRVISYGTKVAVVMVLFVGAVAVRNKNQKFEWKSLPREDITTMEAAETLAEEVVVEDLPGDVTASVEIPVTEEEFVEIYEEVMEEEVPEKVVEEPAEETVAVTYENYIVQKGDTLASISRAFYGTDAKVSEICQLNEITDGDYIQAGEIILLP